MTRSSKKKTLYTNTFSRVTHHKETRRATFCSTYVRGGNLVSYWCGFIQQLATVLLLTTFMLQPIYAHAEEPVLETGDLSTENEVIATDESTISDESDEVSQSALGTESQTAVDQEEAEPTTVASTSEVSAVSPVATTTVASVVENELTEMTAATTTGSVLMATSSTDTNSGATTTASSETESGGVTGGSSESPDSVTDTATTTATSTDDQTPEPVIESGGSDKTADIPEVTVDTASSTSEIASTSSPPVVVATTTATSSPPVFSVVQTVAGEFSFSKSECTLVEDGSYYCQKGSPQVTQQDDLFSAPDADGDLEIFVRIAGEETQLTTNFVDDASPYFDTKSNTIVWHRLLNDRYQIVTYDLDIEKETVLTDTPVNNMQPTRSGDTIVWQRWVDNNWEIILFDGEREIQLTDSIEHDIAPSIRGTMLIWNVRASDGTHSLKTYDIVDGTFTTIADPDGVAVTNPRMVVVYDAVYENGDTVMKGYDLVTGTIIPLDQTPRDLPEDLPTPDSTGETRALVHAAPSKPENDDSDSEPEPETTPEPKSFTLNIATSSATTTIDALEDLDLRASTTTSSLATTTPNIPDLVIAPITSTTSSSTQQR